MLFAAIRCENLSEYQRIFEDFSARELQICTELLHKISTKLVDGCLKKGFQEIFEEKGMFQKHLFLFSTLHIAVWTG